MLKIEDYNYKLIKDRVALHPPAVRGKSKLLLLDKQSGNISDGQYSRLADYLEPGSLVILNNTKVVHARLFTRKAATQLDSSAQELGVIELLFLEKHKNDNTPAIRKAIYRGNLKQGDYLELDLTKGEYNHAYLADSGLEVVEILGDGIALIRAKFDIDSLLEKYGEIPIPPYLKRNPTMSDRERYQTEFAKENGSVAAPTASLNFTKDLISNLEGKGIMIRYLTLHVGSGTFIPIRTEDMTKHKMHEEYYEIPGETVSAIRKCIRENRAIVAIGTTVTRALEHAESKLLIENSDVNKESINKIEAEGINDEADIFIHPGYKFKVVTSLLTNFHAPRSTVLMLAAAFAGKENLMNAYEHALRHNYKFLSYGDSMLIS